MFGRGLCDDSSHLQSDPRFPLVSVPCRSVFPLGFYSLLDGFLCTPATTLTDRLNIISGLEWE